MEKNITILKKQFLEYLEVERGRSLKTIENYDRYLRRFFGFTPDGQAKIKDPKQITDDLVRKYRLWLNRCPKQGLGQQETLSRKTQNYYLIALRLFLKYLARRDIESLPAERIELAKVPERDLDLISDDELERLIDAPTGDDLKSLRDKAILELLFSTGLRVSELCNLDVDSVDLKKDEFSVRGKGEKVRLVFLSDTAKESVKKYIDKRVDTDEALFVRISRGGVGKNVQSSALNTLRLTARSVERIIKYYAIKAGISKKVTPHIIRHCFATDLLSNGADIRSVQSLLGHSSITTTQIYTHVTDKQLRDVHKAFHGKKRGG